MILRRTSLALLAATACWWLAGAGPAEAQVVGITKIVDRGPASERFNLVLLADGYTAAQQAQFAADAVAFANHFAATPPFDRVGDAVNIWRIDAISNESGADDPAACGGTGAVVDTIFDATFCGTNVTRRTLLINRATVLATLASLLPEWDVGLVLVNSGIHGGAASGSLATTSLSTNFRNVAIHELGHMAFGLADEYESHAGCGIDTNRDNHPAVEPSSPNVTTETSRSLLKWRELVDAATPLPTTQNADCSVCDPQGDPLPGAVGLYEGAHYYHCDAYRPEFRCKMKNSSNTFCEVCTRRIEEVLAPFRCPDEGRVWEDKSTSSFFSNYSAMTFDARAGLGVLFGGGGAFPRNDETWTWDGAAWTQVTSKRAPLPRGSHAMAYDPLIRFTLLFGGETDSGFSNELWIFRPGPFRSNWNPFGVVGASPPARSGHGFVHDRQSGKMVLFGGWDGTNRLNDTWEFDWRTRSWTQRFPAAAPSPRADFAMTYDAIRDVTVLYGGDTATGASTETWEYSGGTWQQRSPFADPGPIDAPSMAFHRELGVAVLFGSTQLPGATWEYDGQNWTSPTIFSEPTARGCTAFAYDSLRRETVMTGHCSSILESLKTWVYAGESSTQGFCISGTSTGAGWSWSVSGPTYSVEEQLLAGLTAGSTAADLAAHWVDSIRASSCGSLSAATFPNAPQCFSVTVGGPPFSFTVGPFGQPPNCTATGGSCAFNPTVEEIPLSATDCNGNENPDSIDIASGLSADVDLDGVPDECAELDHRVSYYGVAQGGTVVLTIEGVEITVVTTPGMTLDDIALASADAILQDAALMALGVEAVPFGPDLLISGTAPSEIDVAFTDPGIDDEPVSIPALPGIGIALLGAALLGAAGLALRRG